MEYFKLTLSSAVDGFKLIDLILVTHKFKFREQSNYNNIVRSSAVETFLYPNKF